MTEETLGEWQDLRVAEITSPEKTVSSQLLANPESMSNQPQPDLPHIPNPGSSNSEKVQAMEESIGEVTTAQVNGPLGGNNRRTARYRRQQHEQFRGQDRVDAEAGPSLIDHLVNPKLIPEKRYVRFDDFHYIESLPSKLSKRVF